MSTQAAMPACSSAAPGSFSLGEITQRVGSGMPLGAGGVPRRTEFSACRKYRYTLWREWPSEMFDVHDGYLMVIGLNPSTADETKDDPTIRRCIGFAKAWGFGALCMTNLFAWRDTDPSGMKRAMAPIGETLDSGSTVNDQWLLKAASGAGMILAAWGKHGGHLGRANAVVAELESHMYAVHCLGKNGDGTPKHPLYLAAATKPILLGGGGGSETSPRHSAKKNAKFSDGDSRSL